MGLRAKLAGMGYYGSTADTGTRLQAFSTYIDLDSGYGNGDAGRLVLYQAMQSYYHTYLRGPLLLSSGAYGGLFYDQPAYFGYSLAGGGGVDDVGVTWTPNFPPGYAPLVLTSNCDMYSGTVIRVFTNAYNRGSGGCTIHRINVHTTDGANGTTYAVPIYAT